MEPEGSELNILSGGEWGRSAEGKITLINFPFDLSISFISSHSINKTSLFSSVCAKNIKKF